MKVIVDTVIWSLVFRRQAAESTCRDLLADLISDGRVVLLGAVRQEVLSGIRHAEQFERLKQALRAFPDQALDIEDYELAAKYFSLCRSKGIQGANTDFLICAASVRRKYEILTTDRDFTHFATVLPIMQSNFGR
ncbi:MAG: PIN domain-containing protein [Thermosynechococcaceae cyanobacterium]